MARWRRQGLRARRFVIDGRTKAWVPRVEPQRLLLRPIRTQVERGTRFRQPTEAEREEIIRRARRMALAPSPGQARALVEIAENRTKMSRFTETIRLTLKAHDRDHPDRAIFPQHSAPARRRCQSADLPPLPHGVSAEVLLCQQ